MERVTVQANDERKRVERDVICRERSAHLLGDATKMSFQITFSLYHVLMPTSSLIIALGAGLNQKNPGDPAYLWIGTQTELRAAAAAKLWKEHGASGTIIFSGGRPGGEGTPSEAEAMQGYVERNPWNVPESVIITENNSIDTAENIKNVAAIIHSQNLPIDAVYLVSSKKNGARAAAYLRAWGICSTLCFANNVLGDDIQTYHLPVIPDVIQWPDRRNEILLRILQLFDRKGYIATWYKKRELNIA